MNSPAITPDEEFDLLDELSLLLIQEELCYTVSTEDRELFLLEYESLGDGNYRRKAHNQED